MNTLLKLKNKDLSYNADGKKQFHNSGKRQLRKLAREQLGLKDSEFEVRSCLGGIAVAGEVILHTDKFYLQIHESFLGNDGLKVMYRTCNGRKDYTGGQNMYVSLEHLFTPEFAAKLRKMQAA